MEIARTVVCTVVHKIEIVEQGSNEQGSNISLRHIADGALCCFGVDRTLTRKRHLT